MSRAGLLLTLACLSFDIQSVVAQPVAERTARVPRPDSLRLSLGAGLGVVSGPSTRVDGESSRDDGPGAWPPFLPTAVLRADMPLGPVILGAQTSIFYWEATDTIERFGDSGHYTFDLSALIRVRLAFGRYHKHEIVLSAPFGPSFDTFELGPRRFGGKLDNEVGWHAGGFVGYQFIRGGDAWGVFGEAGLVYHHIPKTIEYPSAREELVFEPHHLFIRGGFILMPFR